MHALTPTAAANPTGAQARPAELVDALDVFTLVIDGARDGIFSPELLTLQAQAGLLLQLIGTIRWGRLVLGATAWPHASLTVVGDRGQPLGFALLTRGRTAQDATYRLAMCAVVQGARGQGHGARLLSSVFGALPADASIDADCRPDGAAIQRLLRRLAFRPVAGAAPGLQRWRREARPRQSSEDSSPSARSRVSITRA